MQRSNSISPSSIFPRFSVFHLAAAVLLAVMAPAAWAQDASSVPPAPSAQTQNAMPMASQPFDVREYSKPRAPFPNFAAPYTPRRVAPPNLANTPRIDQLMHDGKLYISMNDAVALALENNLDIAIARYNLNIADTDVWRAKAGCGHAGGEQWRSPEYAGRGRGRSGRASRIGPGRNILGGGRRRSGDGRPGRVTFGIGPQITSFDPILHQYACNSTACTSIAPDAILRQQPEHDHREFRLYTRISMGHEHFGRV